MPRLPAYMRRTIEQQRIEQQRSYARATRRQTSRRRPRAPVTVARTVVVWGGVVNRLSDGRFEVLPATAPPQPRATLDFELYYTDLPPFREYGTAPLISAIESLTLGIGVLCSGIAMPRRLIEPLGLVADDSPTRSLRATRFDDGVHVPAAGNIAHRLLATPGFMSARADASGQRWAVQMVDPDQGCSCDEDPVDMLSMPPPF